MAGTIYLSEKESSLRHFKDLFSKIRGFRFVDNARVVSAWRDALGSWSVVFDSVFTSCSSCRAQKRGDRFGKEEVFERGRASRTTKGPSLPLPVPRLPGVLLSLSLSLCARVLSAYSETSFVVKLEGPRAVTYADTLRVIREPPWFLPYLDSTCSFRGF